MTDVCEPFKHKHITLLGLGLLGRGVGDAEFLAGCGAEVVVTDKKDEKELAESVERLKKFSNIEFHLGGHQEKDFERADLVIKAAGVPLDSHEVEIARKNNVPIVMSTALFAKYAMEIGAKIVGVTGTRGKSTVSQMIYHTLTTAKAENASWIDHEYGNVYLGGNVRGISTLALLPKIKRNDIVVLELDSWQLQGFGDLEISPNIAVFTNLMPDHMNYYGGDMEKYFQDKANIFKYQKDGDALIVGKEIETQVKDQKPPVAVEVGSTERIATWNIQVLGEHNRENAALATEALSALLLSEPEIQKGMASFEAVEGRLQFVREVNGVKIFNDNNATTPEATIAALRSLDAGKKNIILIMGGSDKQLDMNALLYEIAKDCKRVILLAGTGTDRVVPLIADYSLFDNLESAVREALQGASADDVVLFSPAFASFGMFKNEYERNDEFLRIVRSL